ncbi:MAG: hypothetical protein RLY93_19935 [Sumerlaeia bacterium]
MTPANRSLYWIGYGVFLELIRRKDAYVLLILMSLFFLGTGVIGLVGIENQETGTFLLNLGLTLAYYMAHLLLLILIVRQIPDEIENRTVYPLLAKPMSRSQMFLGKWIACTLGGIVSLLVLGFLGWIPVPKGGAYSWPLLFQGLVLLICSLAMLAALAGALSLLVPRAVALVGLGLWFAFGSQAIVFLRARAADGAPEFLARWLTAYLPDFGKLNLITRYTDTVDPQVTALGVGEFGGLILYAAIFTALALVAGVTIFNKRPL